MLTVEGMVIGKGNAILSDFKLIHIYWLPENLHLEYEI